MIGNITKCRMCGSSGLKFFLDLGNQPLANSFLKKDSLTNGEKFYPLKVLFCQNCNLCQLSEVVSPEVLFRNYVYFSSGMPVLPDHFKNYAQNIFDNFITNTNNLVVEIGSNDGLLLGAIKNLGVRVLGVDPAINIAKVANDRGVETIPDFFSEKLAHSIHNKYGPAKVIIGNNVVAHIDDHNDLINGVKALLDEDGVFVFEAPYLVDMFENLTFDTVYHEHLSYLALRPIKKFVESYGMEVFNVEIYPVQGISFRVFVGRKGKHNIYPSVNKLLKKEKEMKLDIFSTYVNLARKISLMKDELVDKVKLLKKDGAKIAGYGSPAKGNTLLNYYGLDDKILDYCTEELSSKIGLYTPGMHIPVIHINDARKSPPDYYLMLAWNYKDAILKKEEAYRKSGGRFIMPVGKIEIL